MIAFGTDVTIRQNPVASMNAVEIYDFGSLKLLAQLATQVESIVPD